MTLEATQDELYQAMTASSRNGTHLGPLAAALAKAQAAFPVIVRDKEVDSRSFKFKYAPLDAIISAVRGPLSANGLAITQLLDGSDLVTMLLHESGASLQARSPLPYGDGATVQQIGSAITYLRRYALQAILGVAAEEDDDGNAAPPMPTRRVDRSTGEIVSPTRPRPAPAAAPSGSGLSPADVAELHARFAEPEGANPAFAFSDKEIEGIAPAGGLSTVELFSKADEAGVTKAQITVAAKTLFGANRWKVTDLTDEERLVLWEEVHP